MWIVALSSPIVCFKFHVSEYSHTHTRACENVFRFTYEHSGLYPQQTIYPTLEEKGRGVTKNRDVLFLIKVEIKFEGFRLLFTEPTSRNSTASPNAFTEESHLITLAGVCWSPSSALRRCGNCTWKSGTTLWPRFACEERMPSMKAKKLGESRISCRNFYAPNFARFRLLSFCGKSMKTRRRVVTFCYFLSLIIGIIKKYFQKVIDLIRWPLILARFVFDAG